MLGSNASRSSSAGGQIVDPSLEYACKRLQELEGLLLVDVPNVSGLP